jgi:hypothetical protein
MFQEGRYEGKVYYFCSNTDKEEFMKNPMKYVKESEKYISTKTTARPKKKEEPVKKPKPKPEATKERSLAGDTTKERELDRRAHV